MTQPFGTTLMRHPLASKRYILMFKQDDEETMEVFELLSRYEAVGPIGQGTYGYVCSARDGVLAENYKLQLPEEVMATGGYDATTTTTTGDNENTHPDADGRDGDATDEDEERDRYDSYTLVAVKKLRQLFENNQPRMWLCATREIQLMMAFSHDNVMSATDFFIPLGGVESINYESLLQLQHSFDSVYIVMKRMDYTLREVLDSVVVTPADIAAAREEAEEAEEAEGECDNSTTNNTCSGAVVDCERVTGEVADCQMTTTTTTTTRRNGGAGAAASSSSGGNGSINRENSCRGSTRDARGEGKDDSAEESDRLAFTAMTDLGATGRSCSRSILLPEGGDSQQQQQQQQQSGHHHHNHNHQQRYCGPPSTSFSSSIEDVLRAMTSSTPAGATTTTTTIGIIGNNNNENSGSTKDEAAAASFRLSNEPSAVLSSTIGANDATPPPPPTAMPTLSGPTAAGCVEGSPSAAAAAAAAAGDCHNSSTCAASQRGEASSPSPPAAAATPVPANVAAAADGDSARATGADERSRGAATSPSPQVEEGGQEQQQQHVCHESNRDVREDDACSDEDADPDQPLHDPYTGLLLHPLQRDYRKHILYQILRGVGYMHRCPVMHRDLKPENIMLDRAYNTCVTDFGQGRDVGVFSNQTGLSTTNRSRGGGGGAATATATSATTATSSNTTTSPSPSTTTTTAAAAAQSRAAAAADMQRESVAAGYVQTVLDNTTQWYAAPETLTLAMDAGGLGFIDHESFHGVDVWSIGCIAAEMLTGRPLFYTMSMGGVGQAVSIVDLLGEPSPEAMEYMCNFRDEASREVFRGVMSWVIAKSKERQQQNQSLSQSQHTCRGRLREVLRSPYGDEDDDEVELIMRCLQWDPRERTTIQAALESPFFVKEGYEPVIDPDDTAKRVLAVRPEEISEQVSGRAFLWDLFVQRHPEVGELFRTLEKKREEEEARAAASTSSLGGSGGGE